MVRNGFGEYVGRKNTYTYTVITNLCIYAMLMKNNNKHGG